MTLTIPECLRDLLQGSVHEGPLLEFLGQVAPILQDNKTPFFPAYSDHGSEHVTRVLRAAVHLIPEDVWNRDLLADADAAALTAATILHDLALHIREPGFLELVSPTSRFRPLPWFRDRQGSREPDTPWATAWASYCEEAQNFSRARLDNVLGPGHAGVPSVAHGNDDPSSWVAADRLLVGEFLRRHHARLAHEIAIYGFPGLGGRKAATTHAMMPPLADTAGAIARSHNEPLRAAVLYFEYQSPGNRRPSGVLTTYLMALLRIADYLQVDADRAPLVLLRLKAPQSPVSIDEWNKHGSVAAISWDHRDLSALFIEVSATHGLRTHLQLRQLFEDLQAEMDLTSAVLGEQYPSGAMASLRLARTRLYTNILEPSLHSRLPYIPRRAALRSGEDLFRLVIKDLYGNEPAVAGRELVQNAVDAVRARHRWEQTRGGGPTDREFRLQDHDVAVEIRQLQDGSLELRVSDRGIGMTPETVVQYFLQAGISPRPSLPAPRNLDEALDWMRAGRFGVGAFAAFLLGPSITVRTRYIAAEQGVEFRASLEEELVELRWADIPFGTEVIVPFTHDQLPREKYSRDESVTQRKKLLAKSIAEFYGMRRPTVGYRVVGSDGSTNELDVTTGEIPRPRGRLPDDWRPLPVPGLDAVLWAVPETKRGDRSWRGFVNSALSYECAYVSQNGNVIREVEPDVLREPTYRFGSRAIHAILRTPSLAIFDSQHRLGISLTRYRLTEQTLFFEERLLRDIGRDLVAHALVRGPVKYPLGRSWGLVPVFRRRTWIPFMPGLLQQYMRGSLCILWRRPAGPWRAGAEGFLTGNLKSCTWRSLPQRVALTIQSRSEREEAKRFGFDLDDLYTANKELAELTGLSLRASAICRPYQLEDWEEDSDPSDLQRAFSRNSEHEEWTAIHRRRRSDREVYLGGVTGVWRSPDRGAPILWWDQETGASGRKLAALADELAAQTTRYTLALSVFVSGGDSSSTENSPLSKPWKDLVGGFLERSAQGRAARTSQVVEGHRYMCVPVAKWSRTEQPDT
jgi:hypothetical protein